jgi:hypothetical protein
MYFLLNKKTPSAHTEHKELEDITTSKAILHDAFKEPVPPIDGISS